MTETIQTIKAAANFKTALEVAFLTAVQENCLGLSWRQFQQSMLTAGFPEPEEIEPGEDVVSSDFDPHRAWVEVRNGIVVKWRGWG